MRIAGVVQHSFVDGPGIRFVVFTQGCPHHCQGCHNPETHDFSGGESIPVETLIGELKHSAHVDGLTLSGGDPFCQAADCLLLAKAAHELGLTVWAYSGYTYEAIRQGKAGTDAVSLLDEIDILVDGPFLLREKSDQVLWRGSRNQRLIAPKTGKEVSPSELMVI